MNIIELKQNANTQSDIKLDKLFLQFEELLAELKSKELTEPIIETINNAIKEINDAILTGNQLKKLVKQKQAVILKQIEKELKIVPKMHYLGIWMLIGISAIGIPIGVAFGIILGKMGLLGLGIPIGMAIGIAVGSGLDQKALSAGKQLKTDIKY